MHYDQGIHCLYLGIEDSEQPASMCSMIRAFTVYIWALKAKNRQSRCAVWSGHSLSISGHWRLRTTSASVQYDKDVFLSISGHWRLRTAIASVQYDKGMHCLYLGIEDSEQPALTVWSGHSLSILRHWRLRTASASVQYDQGIHCLD